MKRFVRKQGVVTTAMSAGEVDLLDSLVSQLVDLLNETDPQAGEESPTDGGDADDPFALWARDLQSEPDDPEVSEDPVVQRLFPNAYPHDSHASSDFRRFTEREMRSAKIQAANTVRAGLAATRSGSEPVRVADADVDDWLKTLTSVRLSLAARLGIDDAESAEQLSNLADDDPRAFVVSVYDWLGFAQETMIEAL
ncbi:DUF2017 domain-containing protein [Propionibacteriaceae bacterium Y2011]